MPSSQPPALEKTLFNLSSVQREIWFEQSLYPETPIYNIGGYTRINGPIDPGIFRQAITRLVEENEVLRLALTECDGVPFQWFPARPEMDLEFSDFSNQEEPHAAVHAHMQRQIERPFQIFEEPLCRFALYKVSEHCHIFCYTYHHLTVDGWGCALIVQRVAALYSALQSGEPLAICPSVSYTEFVKNDATYLGSASFERHRSYWGQKFAALPEPLFAPRIGNSDNLVPGALHTWWLPRVQYERIEALAKSHSVSAFHVFLGVLYVYVTRVWDRDECVIGLPVLNRNTHAFKQTIGLLPV